MKYNSYSVLIRHSTASNSMPNSYFKNYGSKDIINLKDSFRAFLIKDKDYIDIIPSDLAYYDSEDYSIRHPYSYWRDKSSFIYSRSKLLSGRLINNSISHRSCNNSINLKLQSIRYQ